MSACRPPVTLLLPEGFSKGRPVDPGSYLLLVRNQNHGFRLLVVEIAKHSAAAWASIFATYCDDTGRLHAFPLTREILAYKRIGSFSLRDLSVGGCETHQGYARSRKGRASLSHRGAFPAA